ncbi:MAG: T9SS type A sorting domain-containing protein, partial [Bacteroidota bacterium]
PLTVENEGTWAVQGGSVELEEANTQRDATLAVAEGARLQFNRPLTVEGTLSAAPTGRLALNAALTAGPGATLAVAGTGFEWLSGYLEEGRLVNRELIRFTGANASRGARGETAVLRNTGTVNWEGSGILYVYDGARFENASAFDVSGTGSLRGFSGIGTFSTEPTATLTKTGDALWELYGPLTVENEGTWAVQGGSVELEEANTQRNARLDVASDATLQFNRPMTVLGTLTSAPAGRLVLNSHLLTDRTAELAVAGAGLDWRSGYITEGTIVNRNLIRLTGTANNRGVRGADARLRNAGTMTWRGDGLFYVYDGARFENEATLDIVGNGGLRGFSGLGTFVNTPTGTFTRQGDGVFFFGSDVERNRGFEPFDATLDGAVELGGEIDAIGLALTSRAAIDITGPGGEVGALTWTGDFTLDDGARLRFDLVNAMASDDLFVLPNTRGQALGTAQLDGTLEVVLRDGYIPDVGTSFDLITAEAITGGFTDLSSLTIESADLSLYPSITDEVFSVTAARGIPTISGSLAASPSQVRGGTLVPITLSGAGFAPDLSVALTCVECADPDTYGTLPGQIDTITPTAIGLGLDLTPGDIYGTYEIRVSDPRGGEATTTLVILPPDLTLSVEVRRADASELGNRAGTFVVRSNRQTLAPVTVPFALGGSAQRLADYVTTELGDALTLPLGVTELQVGIIPVNDDLAEPSETVTFTLLDTPDYALGSPATGTVTIEDGPPRGDFAAFSVNPRRGGDAGLLTLTVVGQNFTDGATVSLSGNGPTLESLETQVGEDATTLQAVFDLSDAPIGARDVVVVNGDGGAETLPRAFNVEQSVGADVWVTLVGPEAVRRGRPGTFSLVYGNDGNVDAVGGIFTVMGIPLGADVTFDDSFALPPLPGQDETEQTPVVQDENEQYIVLGAVGLAPGEARTSTFTITTSADYTLQLFAFSDADARAGATGRTPLRSSERAQRTASPASRSNDIPGLVAAEAYLASTAASNNFVTRAAEFVFTGGRDGACVGAAVDNFENLSALTFGTDSPLFGWGVEVVTKNGTGVGHTTVLLTSPDGNYYVADNYTGIPTILPMERSGDNYFPAPENALVPVNAPYLIADGVVNISSAFGGDQFYTLFDERYQTSLRPKPDEQQPVTTVNSFDPNDKIGPGGAGEARYIASTEPMPYLVRFENLDTATAPAAEVIVVDTLDLEVFDPASLTLGPVTFGERIVPVPPGLQDYATTVDLRPEQDLLVLIALTLEPMSGILTARFTSLDPDTGELPEDPFAGFLPPNVTPPEGEGSISFVVAPRDGTGSGTVLRNEARIFFDLNEPIDTPPWINTVDLTAPTSGVVALQETLSDSVFTVTWAGSDANAGVSGFDVYVSQEEGPFEPWLLNYAETSATFVGRNGGSYAFYSIASDFAGNVEPPKTDAEATTTVVVSTEDDAGLPERVTLTQPYPNPASSAMTVPFGLPAAGKAEIEVFDLLGRRVAQLATGDQAAGWHTLRWDVSRLASGVYVLRLRADGVAETRRVTVVR